MKKFDHISFLLVIPARFASSRFPGKPLIDLLGKTMIERVYEQCLKAVDSKNIVVATEDVRIKEFCDAHHMNCIMTSDNCLTGTDRVAEVAEHIEADYYINVQGDEPLFNPKDIEKMLHQLEAYPTEILNGFAPILNEEDYRSLTIPKVVFRPDGRLLYMSRAPIPGNKKNEFVKSWRQICIYSFPKEALLDFTQQKQKKELEQEEDIEILRFLEMGYDVRMIELSTDSIAIDTPEDVEKVIKKLNVLG